MTPFTRSRAALAKAPPKFEPFPKLPLELRLKIWMHASFIPRVVDIYATKVGALHDESVFNYGWGLGLYTFRTRTPVPAVLRTNHESRVEAQKYYKLQFDFSVHDDKIDLFIGGRVYVNFDSDIIMPMLPFGGAVTEFEFCCQPIRHIAFAVTPDARARPRSGALFSSSYVQILDGFEWLRLERIILFTGTLPPGGFKDPALKGHEFMKLKDSAAADNLLTARKNWSTKLSAREQLEKAFWLQHGEEIKDHQKSGNEGLPKKFRGWTAGYSEGPWKRPIVQLMSLEGGLKKGKGSSH